MPKACIRILHVDDNPLDAELVTMMLDLEKEKFPTSVQYVKTKEEYLAALDRRDFDLILSDYRMGSFDGDQALRAAREKCPEIPFIMVTGELGEEKVIETLKRGATDYVLKDRLFRLIPAITRALAESETERKRVEAEESLHESLREIRRAHRDFQEMLESVQDALYGLDREWRFTYVNPMAEKLLFKTQEELIGRVLWEVFPQAAGTESETHLRYVMEQRVPDRYETHSAVTGSWIEVKLSPKADGGISVMYRDIRERKAQEEALRLSEERFSAAFRGSPIPELISRVEDGVYLDVNDATLAFSGMTYQEMIGHSSFELGILVEPREREDLVERLQREGTVRDFPMHVHTRHRGERLVHLSASLLRSTKEKAMLIVLRDVTPEPKPRTSGSSA